MPDSPPPPKPPGRPKGLFCPHCGGVRLNVICSRKRCSGARHRYRRCTTCGTKLYTREVVYRAVPPKAG